MEQKIEGTVDNVANPCWSSVVIQKKKFKQ